MRAVTGAFVLLLASCGPSGERQQGQAPQPAAVPVLECAVDGASDYGTGCTIERTGAILVIRSATGSFRRLRIAGGQLTAADGAEPARLLGGDFNAHRGGDRPRSLPDSARGVAMTARPILTADEMRAAEEAAIAAGTPVGS